MPEALLRSCAEPNCSELVESGRCQAHARAAERYRGTSTARGYDVRWRKLRQRFRQALIVAGVAPTCGARLPGAPLTNDSICAAEGVLVDDTLHKMRFGCELHTDHIVPHEGDDRLRLDLLNLQLLCKAEHDRKTMREQGGIGR